MNPSPWPQQASRLGLSALCLCASLLPPPPRLRLATGIPSRHGDGARSRSDSGLRTRLPPPRWPWPLSGHAGHAAAPAAAGCGPARDQGGRRHRSPGKVDAARPGTSEIFQGRLFGATPRHGGISTLQSTHAFKPFALLRALGSSPPPSSSLIPFTRCPPPPPPSSWVEEPCHEWRPRLRLCP